MQRSRPPQLRRQLLTWLLVPLSLLLAIDTIVGYRVARRLAERGYDQALVELARDVSLQLQGGARGEPLELSPQARRVLFPAPPSRVAFEVTTPDGRHLDGTALPAPGGAASGPNGERLYDAELGGERVRIVQLAVPGASGRPPALVRVAETTEKREALAREIVLSELAPQLLLVLIAGLVVWHGVLRGLAPLARLEHAVSARSHLDRRPVPEEGVPLEVRPLLASINDLLARLDRVLTLQGRFIADAAHQLKTPIAGLSAQLELALREPDPQRLREAVQAAGPALQRLSRLASQLLSLARNEPEAAGRVHLAPLDLNHIALEVAKDWVPEALKRGIDLGFEPHPEAALVQGDAGRLRELLDNLLDNAVRYSRESGRITVRVRGAPAPGVEVSDDGPSIPPEERERVFERFHRLLGSHRDGSGLGLAIAREIARLHGAEIGLREDTDGIGNTFWVSFPEYVRLPSSSG